MHLIERQPYTSLGLFLFLLGCAHMVSISATQTLLAGLIIYVFYRIYRRDYDIAVLPHVIAFALLFVLASLSAFLGVNPQRSMGKVFGWWIYLFFAAMFLLSYYQVRVLPHLTLFVTLGADAAAGLGVYQYFIGGLERANGFFTHALTYANTLGIVLCMVIALLLSRAYQRRWEFWFYAVSTPLILLGMGVSISRGPMLAALITLFGIFILRLRGKGVVICGVILLAWSLVIVSTPELRKRYVELVDRSWSDPHTSVGVRVPLWQVAVDIIADHPIFGIGERNFRQEALKRLPEPLHTMAHAHNTYLQFALTHGIPAFAVLIYLLGSIFLVMLRKALSRSPYGLASLAVICVFLLEGLTENVLGDSEVAMLFFSLMGTFYGYFQRSPTEENGAGP